MGKNYTSINFFSSDTRADLNRYSTNYSFKSFCKAVLTHPGARFMFLYRKCQETSNKSIFGLFYRFWFSRISRRSAIEIPHACKLGRGLYMGHFKAIIINQNAKIGVNCNISQGVTIGRESRGKREGSPKIGDRVLIGANSVVVGNISIGDDVLIAPLTFVNFDVPANSVVLGNPAKIVSNKGSHGYIKKILI
ncbi:serine O-acetyltransferase [Gillisia sp. CAL575]|uniref:serine O-acetyltransferase n=1 Tax=Gillisia sp. CAL575 TaxID=985255 RepID=UPI00039ECA3B|nr:DapH/DapD/GlmU-related protein [Gillisia sp. CAL575]